MFYEKVMDYCTKKRISVYRFEKMCNLSKGTVGKWKDNKFDPTLKTLQKIAEATNTTVGKWVR